MNKNQNRNFDTNSKEVIETSLGTKIAYGNGVLADNLALQNFSYLGFSFYFAVVGLPVMFVSIGYILWSIWDAINDPLLGILSDRTRTKWGRRKPWIYISIVPLCLTIIFLWAPPMGNILITFVYFLIMLILFDLFNTMYTVNFNSLWPEMFLTVEDRSSLGVSRSIFMIIGLAIAFLLPEFIIEDIPNRYNLPNTPYQYLLNGIIASIIIFITVLIMLKFGAFERKEFSKDVYATPSWKRAFKITLKNKVFILYCVVALAIYIVYSILPPMLPFYAEYVIGMQEPGLLLFLGLLVGAISTPLWMHLREKLGVRKSFFIALTYWAAFFLIFLLAFNEILAYIIISFMGVGLGGSLYLYDQGIAEIIDDDEVRSGMDVRREGAYYGVISLFNRFSNAINALVIGLVFTGAGWAEYEPKEYVNVIFGLQFLVCIWPIIIIIIALIMLYLWPLHGERLEENQKLLDKLHTQKRSKIR